jgi:hypothetical protein
MNNKISEMFEGENSSLRKSFNEACMREECNHCWAVIGKGYFVADVFFHDNESITSNITEYYCENCNKIKYE